MTDRPIIFSAPMIRALLDGRKTQTRRVLKPQPEHLVVDGKALPIGLIHIDGEKLPRITVGRVITRQEIKFVAGDRLWVRETWKPHSIYADRPPRDIPRSHVFFRADDSYAPSNTRWNPPIHMPRWASRLTLIVEGVKIERLQDISEEDARAEGVERPILPHWPEAPYRSGFRGIWIDLHGKDSWDANPWIAAIRFRGIKANIDALCDEAGP